MKREKKKKGTPGNRKIASAKRREANRDEKRLSAERKHGKEKDT